jgi:hypothetical protein
MVGKGVFIFLAVITIISYHSFAIVKKKIPVTQSEKILRERRVLAGPTTA